MMNHFLTEKADRLSVFGQLLASLAKGKTLLLKRTFAKRRSRYKKLGKKVPQAYRVYVKLILRSDAGDARIFVNVELDTETGLYYYGARYLDPKYSRWLSGEPAITDYMAGTSAGEGGIYNTVNLHVYHYAGIGQRSDSELQANNPVKYIDPDGRRTYVVNGINNENKVGSPCTIEKFANMLEAVGVEDVRTFGIYNTRGNWYDGFVDIMNVVKEMFNADVYSDALVETIVNDLKENPLQDGEQLNLIGYSGGGQVIANATEKLNKNGVKVSNMVFIGAPIQEIFDTDSKVLNLIGAFDVLSSIVFGKNTQNKFSGWHGHCGYFDDKNIDNTVEIIFNEIN